MNTDGQTARETAYDIGLLFPVLLLVGVGIVMVYSASSAVALKKFGADDLFLKKQAIFALVGLVALVICRHVPYRWYRPLVYPFLGLALASLIAIHVTDLGLKAGGSARWLNFGIVSFQPSEFARFALILFLAYSLDKKGERLKQFTIGFVPHAAVLCMLGICIIIQPREGGQDDGRAVIRLNNDADAQHKQNGNVGHESDRKLLQSLTLFVQRIG